MRGRPYTCGVMMPTFPQVYRIGKAVCSLRAPRGSRGRAGAAQRKDVRWWADTDVGCGPAGPCFPWIAHGLAHAVRDSVNWRLVPVHVGRTPGPSLRQVSKVSMLHQIRPAPRGTPRRVHWRRSRTRRTRPHTSLSSRKCNHGSAPICQASPEVRRAARMGENQGRGSTLVGGPWTRSWM